MDITIREKAAIQLYLSKDGKISPSELYRVAYSESLERVNALKDLPACANRWFRKKKVQEYLQGQFLLKKDKEERLKEEIKADVVRRIQASPSGVGLVEGVDYSNPDNRRKLYTQIINRSKDDPKTQLDAAKMFEQIQKDDREAPREQKQSRVYLPLRCEACPLYIRERNKLKNE
jgi:hypothetical protein